MAYFNLKSLIADGKAERGVVKDVDLVVSVYDNAHWSKDTDKAGKPLVNKEGEPYKREGVFVQQTVHPESEHAVGQNYLGLRSSDNPRGGRPIVNDNLSKGQFDAVVAAAGDNVSDLKDKDGNVVGKNYGVKADVFPKDLKDKHWMMNTTTLQPSELSVAEVDGKTIQDRVFQTQAANKASKAADKEAEARAEAQAEALADKLGEPQAIDDGLMENDEPQLG